MTGQADVEWPDPWTKFEDELKDAGHSLDKIPREKHEEHMWADGILLWWAKHQKLPTADELAEDMFDEWDDPVSTEEAKAILDHLTSA